MIELLSFIADADVPADAADRSTVVVAAIDAADLRTDPEAIDCRSGSFAAA